MDRGRRGKRMRRVPRHGSLHAVIALGMTIALAAAVANAAAAVLQADAARRAPRRGKIGFWLLRILMRRPRWLLGTILMVLAWPLQVLALANAPITVVQPMLATYAVVLLVFAHFWKHGRVSRRDVWGVLAITAGIVCVVTAAPHRDAINPPASHLLAPVMVIGLAAIAAYGVSRVTRRGPGALIIGAGLAYAWVDFANKLLSNAFASGEVALGGIWIVTILAMGTLALLQENAALQRGRVIHVAPLIGALQDPLPVLMSLWAGVETWGSKPREIGLLALGLALVVLGALFLRRRGTTELSAVPPPATLSGSDPAGP